MKRGNLYAISGPAGVGKGSVVKALRKKYGNIGLSVSMTTRQPRENEVDGETYYFTTREDFEKRIKNGEFLEYNIFDGNNEYYGTLNVEVERLLSQGEDVILEIEVNGAMNVKNLFPNTVTIMVVPPSMEALEKRLIGRDTEGKLEIARRLTTAKKELALLPQYDYSVINEEGKIEECADLIYSLIEAERKKSTQNQ